MTRNFILAILVILVASSCSPTSKIASFPLEFYEIRAQGSPSQMKVRMVSDHSSISSQQEFKIGFFFKISEGWYTYSPEKGKDNIPTEIILELPEGFKVIEERWPLPEPSAGKTEGDREMVYNDDFRVIYSILAPVNITEDQIITAVGRWQICKGSLCTLGGADMELGLETGKKRKSKMFKMMN